MEWTFAHWHIRVSRLDSRSAPIGRPPPADREAERLIRAYARTAQRRTRDAQRAQAQLYWLWQGWL